MLSQPKEEDSCHVTLILKHGKQIRANRNQLSKSSDFFHGLLNSDMKESRERIIHLEHITRPVMRDVLEFFRSGQAKITRENAKSLIEAADYLLLSELKTAAEKFLGNELSISDCISIYYFAEKYRCEELMVNSKNLIFSNFVAVAKSRDFLNLESQKLEQWISSDDAAVSREDDIFNIILKWIEQNKSERKGKFEELFRHVRLAFVSPEYLKRTVVKSDLVKENASCLKLAKEAIKGIYCHHHERKWRASHIVVFKNTQDTFCYQPDEDKWFRLPDPPLCYRCVLSFQRQSCQVCSFQSKMYVFPGAVSRGVGEIYDPQLNCWATFNEPVDGSLTNSFITDLAVVRDQMYFVHSAEGIRSKLPKNRYCSISKYTAESNELYIVLPSTGVAQRGACAVAMGRYLYVLGGYTATGFTASAGRLNTTNNNWEPLASMRKARYGAMGIAAHGKIFIAGGLGEKSCEVYTPETDAWHFIANLNVPRYGGNMVCLKDTLYVVGGVKAYPHLDSSRGSPELAIESYDLQKDEWQIKTRIPIGWMNKHREYEGRDVNNVKACTLHIPHRNLPYALDKKAALKLFLLGDPALR